MTSQVTSLTIHLYVLTPGYSVAGGEFSGDDEEGKDLTERRVWWPWKIIDIQNTGLWVKK